MAAVDKDAPMCVLLGGACLLVGTRQVLADQIRPRSSGLKATGGYSQRTKSSLTARSRLMDLSSDVLTPLLLLRPSHDESNM